MSGAKRKANAALNGSIIDLTGSPDRKRSASRPSPQRFSSLRVSDNSHTSITMASYNVWFGPHTGPLHDEARMNAIISELMEHRPHLIGLQEVTPDLASVLCPLLESAGYNIVLQDMRDIGYGCAVALKADTVMDSGFYPFQHTVMDRGIVWALVRIGTKEILFTTTHLESFVRGSPEGETYDGVEQRAKQAKQMAQFCQNYLDQRETADMAVITGDLNWDDQRVRATGIDEPLLSTIDKEKWVDLWKLRHPSDPGYTYDAKESPMLRGKLRRRFDRCLVHSKKPISVESVDLIGRDALPNLTWRKAPHPMARSQQHATVPVTPSDHFGLVAKVNV